MLEQRYRPLCRAILQRPLRFAAIATPTHTDGQTLFVRDTDNARERQIELVVQCLLLRAGSLDKSLLLHLVGKPERARRYLTLEISRVVRAAPLLARLILRNVLPLSPVITESAQQSLTRSSDRGVAIIDDIRYGSIRPLAVIRQAPIAQSESAQPKGRGSSTPDAQEAQELGDDEEGEDISRRVLNLFASVLNIRTPFATLFQDLMNMRSAPGESSGESGGGDPGSSRGKLRPVMRMEQRRAATPEDLPTSSITTSSNAVVISTWQYPEWDARRRHYRDNWCSVHEIGFADVSDVGEPRRAHRDPWLERGLRRVCLELERVHRQDDGDDIDFDALLAHAIEFERTRRSGVGELHDSRVFSRLVRQRPHFGVSILLDISGSTREQTESGRRITDMQCALAEMLVHSLTRHVDRVAALAFHGMGRDGVRAIRFKHFDQPWTHAASATLRSLQASGYTRIGAALRHAAHNLRHDSGCEKQLLIMLSDGHPFDDDYTDVYAQADVAAALREIGAQSMRVLWIAIGELEPYLDKALREHRHAGLAIVSNRFDFSRIQQSLLTTMKQLLSAPLRKPVRPAFSHGKNPEVV
jgi:Mg-chelatase subunit ChlD